MKTLDQGVLAARGFRTASVCAGLKSKPGTLDMGLILSDAPAAPAGCFTTNRVCSAAVVWSRAVARRKAARAVLVNSGNANACTGEQGLADAKECAERAAALLGLKPQEVFVASTGIIGRPLPMEKMRAGIEAVAADLGQGEERDASFARAIMTTDTVPKQAAVSLRLPGGEIRIGGAAKGAGMISPQMATMLAFLTTDAAVSAPLLKRTLRSVVERTFNRITVDGDTSTNDSVFLLANGASNAHRIDEEGPALDAFAEGLQAVAESLARAIASDGEGATKLVVVHVRNARNERDADAVARAIANSPLVKCSVHSGDPNWGRIVCAAGYSGAPVEPDKVTLLLGGIPVFRNGQPIADAPRDVLKATMSQKEVLIELDLGQGGAEATMWTCDLSQEYVAINAEYPT